ncbi:hypothetical protein [Phaeobacter sp. J2-8]|uniref:hypothetical protein n=1 Tax=Phaeobacter sp. J2-8 TaxID=2931394 RepID=UPI001FD1CA03|nr:hypothetical protein [Phaeobacter sp. J2-8]MCJ7872286.1 hypothetical protein [Phaeobacter sp. J2-8]
MLKQISETGGMLDDEYLPILQRYVAGAQSRAGGDGAYQTADDVAEVVMDVMNSAQPPVRIRTSDWANDLTQLKTGLDPDGRKLRDLVYDRFLG